MSSPQGFWGGPNEAMLETRLRNLEAEITANRERGVRSAGAFSIKNGDGIEIFLSGPTSTILDPSGRPQWVSWFKDINGQFRWALYDPNPLSGGYVQTLYEWDHLDNIIRTTDILGGWAEPWLSVYMYPKFQQVNSGVFVYMTTPVNVAEQTLWEGRLGYVSHPYVHADLQGGAATGTNTTRYRLKINNVTAGTWDVVGAAFFGGAVLALGVGGTVIGSKNVAITVTAQSLSGSGTYACQVWGMHMRQSP